MIEIFEKNWDGNALAEPVQYSIGYHPSNFNTFYQTTITNAMTHLDQFLASEHRGPVIYETLSNAANIWPQN